MVIHGIILADTWISVSVPTFPYIFATQKFIKFESIQTISNNILSTQLHYIAIATSFIKLSSEYS